MSYIVQHIRSTEEGRRPRSSQLVEGQIAANVNDATPGIFLTTTEDNVVKIGPAHVGTEEPLTLNSGLSKGELWYNTGTQDLNVYDGTNWRTSSSSTLSTETATLAERLDILETDRTSGAAVSAGDAGTLAAAKQYTDDFVGTLMNEIATKVSLSTFEDLGTFTGSTITDGASVQSAFQQLETAIESINSGTTLSNIVDGAQGVEVTGRVAAEGLDLSVGGQLTAAGCSIDFGSATISFSGASISGLSGEIRENVDLHLNQSTATDGQILSWNATGGGDGTGDYEWITPAAAGAEADTLDTVTARGAATLNDITVGKCYFGNVFSVLGDLPSATTHHGMFAHVHSTGHGYFAHNGNWVKLANHSELGTATAANFTFNASIIPDTNAAYDLGSAEYKVRHLFLSDNSIKFGDAEIPLSVNEGDLEFGGIPVMPRTLNHVLTTLGVASYADNAAAAYAGLVVGDVYYDTTLNKLTSVTA